MSITASTGSDQQNEGIKKCVHEWTKGAEYGVAVASVRLWCSVSSSVGQPGGETCQEIQDVVQGSSSWAVGAELLAQADKNE